MGAAVIRLLRKIALEILLAILKSSAKFGGAFKLEMLAQMGAGCCLRTRDAGSQQ
jgi:hypothetical protein